MEDIEIIIDSAREQMEHSISHLEKQLVKIRAGRAQPQHAGRSNGGVLWQHDAS